MSPIDKGRYPIDWPVISRRIRLERAGGRCECDGRCGREDLPHPDGRCEAVNKQPAKISGSPVVLTTAHLDHDTTHNSDDNLLAMCQACHLAYDAERHALTRAAKDAEKRADQSGALPLPGLGLEL